MNDIQKAGFFRNWYDIANDIEDPAERLAFYEMLMKYAFEGIEPVKGKCSMLMWQLFQAVRPNIDADVQRKKGGAPAGNQNARKVEKLTVENEGNNIVDNSENENNIKTTLKTTVETTKTNEEEVEEEVEEEEEVEVALLPPPLKTSSEYSKKVFEVFLENELPCCRKNELSFLQTDFKNGIYFIHKNYPGMKSDDLIQACKNYASVVNNENAWFSNRYGFARFVQLKNFEDFLPGNFVLNNFLKDSAKQKPEQKKKDIPKIKFCPNCRAKITDFNFLSPAHLMCNVCNSEMKVINGQWIEMKSG